MILINRLKTFLILKVEIGKPELTRIAFHKTKTLKRFEVDKISLNLSTFKSVREILFSEILKEIFRNKNNRFQNC